MLSVTILGTGPSVGMPVLGCPCDNCINPRNQRSRSSVLLTYNDKNIIIDTSPDLKKQLIYNNKYILSAIVYTHDHFDHTAGFGEIIPLISKKFLNKFNIDSIDIYADKETLNSILNKFNYIFNLKHCININTSFVIPKNKFTVCGLELLPISNNHGEVYSMGYIFNNCAYITDFKYINDENMDILQKSKIKILIISCLGDSTKGHAGIDEVMYTIKRINPIYKVYLTHMGHSINIDNFLSIINFYKKKHNIDVDIIPSYDNMTFNVY